MDTKHFIAKRASQFFKKGDVVNLGIGIPSFCADYAAEGVLFHTENGLIGVGKCADGLQKVENFSNAMGIEFIPVRGACAFDSAMSFAMIRSGKVAVTVQGGLQVSQEGDLANWDIPGKTFGMSGAMDLACGCKKVIVAMELCTKDDKPKILNRCTLPLTGVKCVHHIVTELCVIDVTPDGLMLKEIREGYTPEDIQSRIEPKLILSKKLQIMQE